MTRAQRSCLAAAGMLPLVAIASALVAVGWLLAHALLALSRLSDDTSAAIEWLDQWSDQ